MKGKCLLLLVFGCMILCAEKKRDPFEAPRDAIKNFCKYTTFAKMGDVVGALVALKNKELEVVYIGDELDDWKVLDITINYIELQHKKDGDTIKIERSEK